MIGGILVSKIAILELTYKITTDDDNIEYLKEAVAKKDYQQLEETFGVGWNAPWLTSLKIREEEDD